MTTTVAPTGKVTTFPPAPGAVKSSDYMVTVNGKAVSVETFADIHYAQFLFSGECEVTIAIRPSIGHRNLRYIHRYEIRPLSCEIAAASELNTLRFTLDRPRKLAIRIDKFNWLFLFADSPDTEAPAAGQTGVIDLSDFVPADRGTTAQTRNIEKAIEAVPENGTLFVPPGLYMTGTLHLKSSMTLYLAAGAVLRGSPDPADYPKDADTNHWIQQSLVTIGKAEHVRIAGHGTLDNNGSIVRAAQCGPHLLLIHDSSDVTVENVVLRDAAAWTAHILQSERVTLRGIKIVNNWDVLNTDAIDPCSSRDVLIEDCFLYTSDDGIVIKSHGGTEARDIMARRNVVLSKKSALKIGTESAGDITNVTFEDNDVVVYDRGMTLACEDGHAIRNTEFIRNRFEVPYPDARRRLIDFYTWNRNGGGRIENTVIEDCVAYSKAPHPSTLFAASGPIDGLHFRNMVLEGRVCSCMEDLGLHIDTLPCNDWRRVDVRNITFEPGPRQAWNHPLVEAVP